MQQEPLPVPGTNAPVTRVEMLDQDLLPRPEVPGGAYLKLSPTEVQVILAEYEALRAEMVKQIELRQQPISITIVAFGGLIAASAQSRNPTFVLLYPTLALFLAAMWSYHNRVTHRIGRYIRYYIEAKVGTLLMGWEHNLIAPASERERRHDGGSTLTDASFRVASGVFAGSALLAMLVGAIAGYAQVEQVWSDITTGSFALAANFFAYATVALVTYDLVVVIAIIPVLHHLPWRRGEREKFELIARTNSEQWIANALQSPTPAPDASGAKTSEE